MTLSAAEGRILRAALREFQASLKSEFTALRDFYPFLRASDANVDLLSLRRKFQLEGAARRMDLKRASPRRTR
jgi:hypothetical protein